MLQFFFQDSLSTVLSVEGPSMLYYYILCSTPIKIVNCQKLYLWVSGFVLSRYLFKQWFICGTEGFITPHFSISKTILRFILITLLLGCPILANPMISWIIAFLQLWRKNIFLLRRAFLQLKKNFSFDAVNNYNCKEIKKSKEDSWSGLAALYHGELNPQKA